MNSTPAEPAVDFPVAAVSSEVVGVLRDWSGMAARAYSQNTLRAWKADWAGFSAYCDGERLAPLPAVPHTVRGYVLARVAAGARPASVRRAVATIARAHLAAGIENPCIHEAVRLALKEMGRTTEARQRQARALTWTDIARYLETAPSGLRDLRNRALVAVAYDAMLRRSELVAVNVEDIERQPDGSGSILVRRSKTDPTGEGALAYLAPLTMRLLDAWTDAARIASGALFPQVSGAETVEDRLDAGAVPRIFKSIAATSGVDTTQVSGHSVRVGAAQDLLALNTDLASLMQAGRWKDTRMPLRYGERVLVTRSAMAVAATKQGRV